MPDFHSYPGFSEKLAAAYAQEEGLRELAFIDAPRELCGVPILQLTLRHLVLLYFGQCAFLAGGTLQPQHIGQFFWILSPGFELGNDSKRDEFLRSIINLDVAKASDAIDAFIDEAFMDHPGGAPKNGPAFTCFAAGMVHRFAKAYGWSEDYILDRPIARLFQYLRWIIADDNPKYPFPNGISGKVKSDLLKELNGIKPKKKGGRK